MAIGQNFNTYPRFNPMPDIQGAGNIQQFGTLGNNWDLTEQRGLSFDPLTTGPVQNSYGKHHDRHLIGWSFTCCLQAWESRRSHIQLRVATTPSQCTLENTCLRSNFNHSPPVPRDGMVPSPPGRPWNHMLLSRA